MSDEIADSKVHGANIGPIWGWQDPGGPHIGPMNFVIWDVYWGYFGYTSLQWRHNECNDVSNHHSMIVYSNVYSTIVYSTVYLDVHQRKHQSSALLAFVRGIHRWHVNSPYKRSVKWKMFSFDDVIILMMLSDHTVLHIFVTNNSTMGNKHA